ncbi:hypothetical protein KSD_41600 [Ktedonobacter sp. SOSP1-85]|nr:hypothetical protein KSD_41600 [Ktedonobacter sp. SOSP1-85]
MLGNPATCRGTNDRGEAPDRARDALPLGTLTGREEVSNDGDSDRHECTRANALEGAKEHKLIHRLRCPGECGTSQKDDDTHQEDGFTPKDI